MGQLQQRIDVVSVRKVILVTKNGVIGWIVYFVFVSVTIRNLTVIVSFYRPGKQFLNNLTLL